MLRDHLVCGIVDVRIQRRLLAEPNLTFQKAMELAQAKESSEKDAAQLKSSQHTQAMPVHKLHKGRSAPANTQKST